MNESGWSEVRGSYQNSGITSVVVAITKFVSLRFRFEKCSHSSSQDGYFLGSLSFHFPRCVQQIRCVLFVNGATFFSFWASLVRIAHHLRLCLFVAFVRSAARAL